jgi:hypothetical protein
MLRINRCLYRAFLTALLTRAASAQDPLTCPEVRDTQKGTRIATYFFSPYHGFAGSGSEVDGLAAVLNYVTPFGFAIGVEPEVPFPAQPANGSAICNDALEMFDTAQATPTNVDLSPKLRQTVKSQNTLNGKFDSWEFQDERLRAR